MAQYKYREHVLHVDGNVFDTRHAPGTLASNPGIYRCAVCGDEITVQKNCRLPSDTHHPHDPKQGRITWQLLVYAQESK
jgi:hypothetical protein